MNCAFSLPVETEKEFAMELPVNAQDVETTINELILALRENAGDCETNQRETQILVAYALSGLFGSEGPCSHLWN